MMSSAAATLTATVVGSTRLELTDSPDRYVLAVETDGAPLRFDLEATPSLSGARRFERCVRRVHLIRFCRHADGWSASVEVTGHRLPHCRPVPIGIAVALGLQGRRITVCPDTLASEGVDDGRLPL
ncbi:MAG: hypothetical protein ABJH68_04820 [Ilumatobacter sp.]|uniref:hypothetical protein n=1 Tax=Ilumatobacter sp. TaxID=1967498 RepID=UPI00329917F4